MTKLLAAAAALALLGSSAAFAQPNGDQRDHHDNGGYDNRDHSGDHGGDRGDHRNWGDHHHGHTVCTWRHHHRVCYRQGW